MEMQPNPESTCRLPFQSSGIPDDAEEIQCKMVAASGLGSTFLPLRNGRQDAAEGVLRLSVFESAVQSLWKRSMVRFFVSMETYLGTY